MSDDWFRNRTWNERIAANFEDRLRRARRKEQYLRIQASTLAQTHPTVALELLERYFASPDDFDRAQAYVDRADAQLALGRVDDALASYEAALRREDEFPKLQTQAYLHLPYLIAVRGVEDKYNRALEVLDRYRSRLTFPADRFKWHAARAFILETRGDHAAACVDAKLALEAASQKSSGFRFHPTVGLVTDKDNDVLQRLLRYSDA